MARTLVVWGCSSGAGKSWLTTALCRVARRRGIDVAPFKAQNMSNNAGVTPDGLGIGRAQYLQALAARAVPDVRMNPILLKPSADTFSHVIVMGKYDHLPRGSQAERPRIVFKTQAADAEGHVGFDCYGVRVRVANSGNQSGSPYLPIYPVGQAS